MNNQCGVTLVVTAFICMVMGSYFDIEVEHGNNGKAGSE